MKKTTTITKHNWFLRLVKKIIKTFRTTPKLIIKTNSLPKSAIFIANHSGAAGPLTLSIYFPKYLVPWGAYPMTGHYFMRWKYLYFTFYRQKLGYNKFRSIFLATLFGLVSKIIYNGVKLIPTYPDARLKTTIKKSIEHLDVNNSLIIFPEDSNDGYKTEIEAFHSGFVFLAKKYYQEKQSHIPIIPIFYQKESQEIRVGKSYTLADFPKLTNRKELAEEFRLILNELGEN